MTANEQQQKIIDDTLRAQEEVPDGFTAEEWAQVWDDAFFGRGEFACLHTPPCGCPPGAWDL